MGRGEGAVKKGGWGGCFLGTRENCQDKSVDHLETNPLNPPPPLTSSCLWQALFAL
jgi:hypothetical protein